MTHKVELIRSGDGYAVLCPDLPGCISQGETEAEAMSNIKSAISKYLEAVDPRQSKSLPNREVRYVDLPEILLTPAQLEPFKVTPIPMGLPPFEKIEDLLDELEGPWRR